MNKKRTIIIIVAAVLVAGIGFLAGMIVKSSVASKAQLSADEAKQIALSSVGVSAEKASFTKAIFDEGVYEVDFYTESNEYDFEVDANTGAIIEREVSPRTLASQLVTQPTEPAEQPTETAPQSVQSAAQSNDDDVIGVDSAKEIALNHANLSNASFTKAYLDYDDGIRVYDIEFNAENKEYDYEINAHTGDIIEYDVDRLDFDD